MASSFGRGFDSLLVHDKESILIAKYSLYVIYLEVVDLSSFCSILNLPVIARLFFYMPSLPSSH